MGFGFGFLGCGLLVAHGYYGGDGVGWHFFRNNHKKQTILLEHLHQWMQIFLLFCTKKSTFSILYTHFYKTPTSVCLFYTFFYLNNIILTFFYYSQLP